MLKKANDTLFQIGEITKTMDITRKTLLVYEEMGLLTPAWKDPDSGYRYYSADNMTQIRSIRSLQKLGLTLKEVKEYYYHTDKIDLYLQRLIGLRAALDRNIQMLEVRSAKHGDTTVRKTTLPRQVCFCRKYVCESIAEASNNLRDTYIAAAHTGKMAMSSRMFTLRPPHPTTKPEITCCIQMDPCFDGPERVEFPETPALCIYHRGPYEEIATTIQALMTHIQENHIEPTGPIRSIYLEGPPNRGDRSEDYITQIAIPIRE